MILLYRGFRKKMRLDFDTFKLLALMLGVIGAIIGITASILKIREVKINSKTRKKENFIKTKEKESIDSKAIKKIAKAKAKSIKKQRKN
jgi:hypothetical protein